MEDKKKRYADDLCELVEYAKEGEREANENFRDTDIHVKDVMGCGTPDVVEEELSDGQLREPYAGTRDTDPTKHVLDDPIMDDEPLHESEEKPPRPELNHEDPILGDKVITPEDPLIR